MILGAVISYAAQRFSERWRERRAHLRRHVAGPLHEAFVLGKRLRWKAVDARETISQEERFDLSDLAGRISIDVLLMPRTERTQLESFASTLHRTADELQYTNELENQTDLVRRFMREISSYNDAVGEAAVKL